MTGVPGHVVARAAVAGRGPRRDNPTDPASVVKSSLPQRFQEAIDEAAMRLGDTSSEAYLEGWTRSGWQAADGTPHEAADRVVAELEATWTPEHVTAYLDALLPSCQTP